MAKKKKLLTAVAAVATAAAVMLGGTFAWQSISQTALNEASDVINPGGRLHDDFNGENKDIYVENFAEDPIYARIQLSEYFEIISNYGAGEGVETSTQLLGSKNDDGTYNYDTFTNYASLNAEGVVQAGVNGTYVDGAEEGAEGYAYWSWKTGGSTVYMPTFNMNKDSLKADINGIYEDGNVGTISDRILDLDHEDAQYSEYKEYADGETLTDDEIYDADANDAEDDGITTVPGVEHTAKSTETGSLISMADWDGTAGPYWVYDTDGWVYWAQAIEPDTATGLLLDSIELNQVMDDTWYYAINVVAQFVTADDVGKSDGTGFYAEGNAPTAEAEALLRAIGVTSVDEEAGDLQPEPESPLQLTITPDQSWYLEGASTTSIELSASATYAGTSVNDLSTISWSISGNTSANTTLSETAGSINTLTIGNDETADIEITATFTYETEVDGETVSETATEKIMITNGPSVGSIVMFGADGNALHATSHYTAGTDNVYTAYFFEKYLGNVTLYDKADAYTGEALELLEKGLTFAFMDEEGNVTEAEGVTLSQNGSVLTLSIPEDFTDTITIGFDHEDWGSGSFTLKKPMTQKALQDALNAGGYIDLTGESVTTTESQTASGLSFSYDLLWHNGGTVNGGTLNLTSANGRGLFINNENNWPDEGDGANTVTMNNTIINANGVSAVYVQAIDAPVNLNNVSITSDNAGLYVNMGSEIVTLNDVTIDAANNDTWAGEDYFNSAIAVANPGHVVINSGSYTGTNAVYIFSSGGTVDIYGGTFDGKLKEDAGTLTIYGGTFTVDPGEYVAEGYEAVNNGDETWTVQEIGSGEGGEESTLAMTFQSSPGYIEDMAGGAMVNFVRNRTEAETWNLYGCSEGEFTLSSSNGSVTFEPFPDTSENTDWYIVIPASVTENFTVTATAVNDPTKVVVFTVNMVDPVDGE